MLVLDRWVENLRCPICRKTGTARLSQTDGWSVHIEVEAEALEIDPARAVTFGLLVNELATNAIKHAFPEGTGRIALSLRQSGDQIELDVADDGVGMKEQDTATRPGKHGAD